MKKLMMAVMVAAIGLSAAAAYTPSFAYQGVLRDKDGKTMSMTIAEITFKVYKSSSDADYLWSKNVTVSLTTEGLFNVELSGAGSSSDGVSTTLDKVVAENANNDLYIGLTVAGSAEISPRQKLIAAPRAIFAHDVKTAQGDFTVKGNLTVAGAINMGGTNDTLSVANVLATGSLTANKEATFKAGVQVGDTFTVSGDAKIGKALTVGGVQMSMPIGAIIMWGSTSKLPADGCWVFCDGKNEYELDGDPAQKIKVPDLSGNFTDTTSYIIKVK